MNLALDLRSSFVESILAAQKSLVSNLPFASDSQQDENKKRPLSMPDSSNNDNNDNNDWTGLWNRAIELYSTANEQLLSQQTLSTADSLLVSQQRQEIVLDELTKLIVTLGKSKDQVLRPKQLAYVQGALDAIEDQLQQFAQSSTNEQQDEEDDPTLLLLQAAKTIEQAMKEPNVDYNQVYELVNSYAKVKEQLMENKSLERELAAKRQKNKRRGGFFGFGEVKPLGTIPEKTKQTPKQRQPETIPEAKFPTPPKQPPEMDVPKKSDNDSLLSLDWLKQFNILDRNQQQQQQQPPPQQSTTTKPKDIKVKPKPPVSQELPPPKIQKRVVGARSQTQPRPKKTTISATLTETQKPTPVQSQTPPPATASTSQKKEVSPQPLQSSTKNPTTSTTPLPATTSSSPPSVSSAAKPSSKAGGFDFWQNPIIQERSNLAQQLEDALLSETPDNMDPIQMFMDSLQQPKPKTDPLDQDVAENKSVPDSSTLLSKTASTTSSDASVQQAQAQSPKPETPNPDNDATSRIENFIQSLRSIQDKDPPYFLTPISNETTPPQRSFETDELVQRARQRVEENKEPAKANSETDIVNKEKKPDTDRVPPKEMPQTLKKEEEPLQLEISNAAKRMQNEAASLASKRFEPRSPKEPPKAPIGQTTDIRAKAFIPRRDEESSGPRATLSRLISIIAQDRPKNKVKEAPSDFNSRQSSSPSDSDSKEDKMITFEEMMKSNIRHLERQMIQYIIDNYPSFEDIAKMTQQGYQATTAFVQKAAPAVEQGMATAWKQIGLAWGSAYRSGQRTMELAHKGYLKTTGQPIPDRYREPNGFNSNNNKDNDGPSSASEEQDSRGTLPSIQELAQQWASSESKETSPIYSEMSSVDDKGQTSPSIEQLAKEWEPEKTVGDITMDTPTDSNKAVMQTSSSSTDSLGAFSDSSRSFPDLSETTNDVMSFGDSTEDARMVEKKDDQQIHSSMQPIAQNPDWSQLAAEWNERNRDSSSSTDQKQPQRNVDETRPADNMPIDESKDLLAPQISDNNVVPAPTDWSKLAAEWQQRNADEENDSKRSSSVTNVENVEQTIPTSRAQELASQEVPTTLFEESISPRLSHAATPAPSLFDAPWKRTTQETAVSAPQVHTESTRTAVPIHEPHVGETKTDANPPVNWNDLAKQWADRNKDQN